MEARDLYAGTPVPHEDAPYVRRCKTCGELKSITQYRKNNNGPFKHCVVCVEKKKAETRAMKKRIKEARKLETQQERRRKIEENKKRLEWMSSNITPANKIKKVVVTRYVCPHCNKYIEVE